MKKKINKIYNLSIKQKYRNQKKINHSVLPILNKKFSATSMFNGTIHSNKNDDQSIKQTIEKGTLIRKIKQKRNNSVLCGLFDSSCQPRGSF